MGDRVYSASVTAPAAFAAVSAPSFTTPWIPRMVTILNEDTDVANYVEISVDGVNVCARLTPTLTVGVELELPYQRYWVRRGAGTPTVRLSAVEK